MSQKSKVTRLAVSAVTAALYVTVTLALAPVSYGSIQFRIAEILNLMAFIDPLYGVGVVLGCFIANIFSELGPIDMIVGTLGTALAVFAITRTKNLFIAALWPMFANTPVAFELAYIIPMPLWLSIVSVWLGEFVVATCIGYPVFRLITKNQRLMAMLRPVPIERRL